MEIRAPKSKEELLELLGEYYSNGDNYYRGQADYSWDITPGIARNKGIKGFQSLLKIESKLIDSFQKKIIDDKLKDLMPKINGSCHESWILLMAAQHYGLPTRLIDFSNDKIIAVLFAISDIQHLNKDGALLVYENPIEKQNDLSIFKNRFVNNLDKSFFIPSPVLMNKENNELRCSEMRKFLQGSKFLYRETQNLLNCLSLDQEHSNSLSKIYISKDLKLEIIKEIIKKDEMVYDLFAGKNELDYYAAILKLQFLKLNDSNINEFLRS